MQASATKMFGPAIMRAAKSLKHDSTRAADAATVLRAVAASQARWPSAMHSQLSHADGSDRLTFQLHDEAAMQYAHQLAS